jgi:hypothetical protein
MATDDREDTQDLLDKVEFSALQTLQNQLANLDVKLANKAANDIVGIRLKQGAGAGGPVLNLHFGNASTQMRQVRESSPTQEKLEIIEGTDDKV